MKKESACAHITASLCTAPCSVVEIGRRIIRVYCLHHQGFNDEGIEHLCNDGLLQRDYTALLVIFKLAAVRTYILQMCVPIDQGWSTIPASAAIL